MNKFRELLSNISHIHKIILVIFGGLVPLFHYKELNFYSITILLALIGVFHHWYYEYQKKTQISGDKNNE